ncbi:hypothetical protein Tco_0774921 [Tanacetum coccineum]|uniref:Uncharacterized protein n=1 Tax=Tanacetum coccineum TaxID=301880 RepID=A0ABQ4ZQS9_9ASTR
MLSVGGGGGIAACQTIWISNDLALSVLIVATLSLVGNFIMPWAVDGTAPRARIPDLPRIPLYCECDLTTKNFIHTVAWYGCFPQDTLRNICPKGQVISPENPTNGMTTGIKLRLIYGLIRKKQCSYKISKAFPPSTYIRWMSYREQTFLPQDWTMKMATPLSFWAVLAFFTVLLVLALCKPSSVLCPLSPWKSQYLFLFLDSDAPDIGGGESSLPGFHCKYLFGSVYEQREAVSPSVSKASSEIFLSLKILLLAWFMKVLLLPWLASSFGLIGCCFFSTNESFCNAHHFIDSLGNVVVESFD